MPHTSSAKKRARQYEKRRLRNRSVKGDIRIQVKHFLSVEKTATAEELQKEFQQTVKKLDKAAAKRIIHPNQAARKKSQLAKRLNQKQTAKKGA